MSSEFQMIAEVVNRCLSCGNGSLVSLLDLGRQPLANNLLSDGDLEKEEPHFQLGLQVCTSCWLVQLTHLVPAVDLFTSYVYFSSYSETMLEHAREASERYAEKLDLGRDSFVVEIASNDGYLLKNFIARSIPCLGVEPAENVAEVARTAGVPTEVAFFGEASAERLVSGWGKADLILGNNVFAHAPDTNDFVAGLSKFLAPEGTVVLEFPYLCELIGNLEFDTVYHEHVFYFSLTALVPLFARHDLMVEKVESLPIHGGSLRVFLRHEGVGSVQPSVARLLDEERGLGVDRPDYYASFSRKVEALADVVRVLLGALKESGNQLAAYGASAKGSTLLNFLALPEGTLDYIVDRSPHKQGKFSPGVHLPIKDPQALVELNPSHTLLLTWNFKDEILGQQKAYRDGGGKFIVPLPTVQVV